MQFVGALCEEVVVLSFGRKIAEGTPDAVRQNALVQEVYLGAPARTARDGTREPAFVAAEREPCFLTCRTSKSATAACMRCAASRCSSTAARSSPCSAPTAPASRRCCARCSGIERLAHGRVDVRRRRHHRMAAEPSRAPRPGAGARGPAHRDDAHRAREPADGRVQPARRQRRGGRDRRRSSGAFPTSRRAATALPPCSPAASSRCWRSDARCSRPPR